MPTPPANTCAAGADYVIADEGSCGDDHSPGAAVITSLEECRTA
eukprot:gene11552-62291_t